MLVDHIFKYFPKGEMTILEISSFFKVSEKKPEKK